jgi:long-chain acyl-CoA synthetase
LSTGPMTASAILRHYRASRADATMFVYQDQEITWSQMWDRATIVAAALQDEGVAKGDRVAFVDLNSPEFFETLFGCALLGATLVPLNWRLAPAELDVVIRDAEPTVMVLRPLFGEVVGTMDSVATLKRIVILPGDTDVELVANDSRALTWRQWTSDRQGRDPGHLSQPDDIALLLYTSGTTGVPKGVMISNRNIATSLSYAIDKYELNEETVSLIAMPLFHIGGIGWSMWGLCRGGRSVILPSVDPNEIVRLFETQAIQMTFVVPAALIFMLFVPGIEEKHFPHLRHIFYGASPIAEDILVKCMTIFGCEFTQLYGMTETTGAICALEPEDHDPTGPRHYLLRSAGKPYPGVQIRIVTESGRDAEVDEVGEIWTKSDYNTPGYWRRPEATKGAFHDGWLRTGDAAYLDKDGYLFMFDRIKDMIVSGAENVYPIEVENVLYADARIADAAVIGVPDERWGEAVKAVVVLKPEAQALDRATLEADLIAFCHTKLAGFKCPKSIDFVDALPRNPTGKVLKKELRAPYWDGASRQIN